MSQCCALYATYQYESHGEWHRYFVRIGEIQCARREDARVGAFYSDHLNRFIPLVTLRCEPREAIFTEVSKSCAP